MFLCYRNVRSSQQENGVAATRDSTGRCTIVNIENVYLRSRLSSPKRSWTSLREAAAISQSVGRSAAEVFYFTTHDVGEARDSELHRRWSVQRYCDRGRDWRGPSIEDVVQARVVRPFGDVAFIAFNE